MWTFLHNIPYTYYLEEVKKMTKTKQIIRDKFLNFLSVTPHILLITLVLLTMSFSAQAHSGDTDVYGCHYDYNDRYHCH